MISRLAALTSCLLFTSPLLGQGSPLSAELRWTHSEDRPGARLQLAEAGGLVLSDGYLDELRLFSSFDTHPPTPVWSLPATPSASYSVVASANSDLVLVTETVQLAPLLVESTVRAYRSSSAAPLWEIVHPPQTFPPIQPVCSVSPDGETVVIGFGDENASDQRITVHDPASGAVLRRIDYPLGFFVTNLQVSADGSTLAIDHYAPVSPMRVIDLHSGTLLHEEVGKLGRSQSISADGDAFVMYVEDFNAPWRVKAFTRDQGGFTPVVDEARPLGAAARNVGVSADGSTMVAVWYENVFTHGRTTVEAYDLSSGVRTMLNSSFADGGSFSLGPQDLSISQDGSRFALGRNSSLDPKQAEVVVHGPLQDAPLLELPAGARASNVELSPDGRHLAVLRRREPDGTPAPWDLQLHRLGEPDFELLGAPLAGSVVSFELQAPVGAMAFLLSAPGPAGPPLPVAGLGLLHPDRAALTVTPIGVVGGSGTLLHDVTLSSDPALVGTTTIHQGWTRAPDTLSSDWVQLTILP